MRVLTLPLIVLLFAACSSAPQAVTLLATPVPTPTPVSINYQAALDQIEQARLENATHLNLMGMELRALPPEIGTLTNLTHLNVSDNRLTTLPPEILNLTNLTSLDVSQNELTTLPPELAEIESLRMACNAFSDLTPELESIIYAEEQTLAAHWSGSLPCQGYAGPINNFVPVGAPPSATPTPQ